MNETIRELDSLLCNTLSTNETIKNTNYTRLTAPGDNYGSIMLKLDVTILNKETKEEKVLNLVAKTLPETELLRKAFNIQTTYTNEIAFYDIIVPTLHKFQTKNGVKATDSFAKCYGTRKNLLENSDNIDDDAVLLLENLKIQGFENVNKKIGFDFETTKLILAEIAGFHASFLALKFQDSDIFKKKVLPYCHNYEPRSLHEEGGLQTLKDILNELSKEDEECLKLAPRVKVWGEIMRSQPREPYATVIHTDLWTNNTMQIFKNGKPIANKFVDFQVFTYGSPAADVFFILWSSVQKPVLENHLDYLLKFYHDEFIDTLENHKCDTSPFSYNKFLDELKLEAEYEFPHSITFFLLLSLGDDVLDAQNIKKTVTSSSPDFKEKAWFMVKECNKRGWVY